MANTKLKSWSMVKSFKAFPIKLTNQEAHSPTSNILSEVPDRAIKWTTTTKKDINCIWIWSEKVKLLFYIDKMILCVYNFEVSPHQKQWELINSITFKAKRLIYRNVLCSYMLIINYQKEKARKQPHLKSH